MLNKDLLPTIEALDSWCYTVVSAAAPTCPLFPAFLTKLEADTEAADLIDCTGIDHYAVTLAELEAQS